MNRKHEDYFARALVNVNAYVDKDPEYAAIYCYRWGSVNLAGELHKESGVPRDKCGLPEVRKMQEYLGPQGYQIKIFEAICGALWFHDPKYDSAPKKLWLLKNGEQFKGIQRVPENLRGGNYCDYVTRYSFVGNPFCCDCKHNKWKKFL